MDIDLERMDIDELRELRGRIDKTISGYRDRKRREAVAAAEEAARAHGFNSLSELTGRRRAAQSSGKQAQVSKGARGATKGEARYANPENPEQTWTGRGRRPQWFQQALDTGRPPEDFAV